jgi:hypothetical protein
MLGSFSFAVKVAEDSKRLITVEQTIVCFIKTWGNKKGSLSMAAFQVSNKKRPTL